MEHLFIKFKIKKGNVEEAKTIIRKFVEEIKSKEPGTILYNCYQEKSDATSFIHTISFESEAAEEHHRHTLYVKDFVEQLYPICKSVPEFSELNLICSNNEEFK
jgi:quinol monooxygenase YgiN